MIHDILLKRFPNVKIVELTGGYTNMTLLIEGIDMKRIAKIYHVKNTDAKTEISALALLSHSGVTPRVYDFFEQDEWLFVMMDYVPGVNAQMILDQDGLDQGRRIYGQLGKYLAREVHCIKRDNKDTELPVIMKSAVAEDGLEFIPNGIKSMANEILSTPDHGEQTLIHGDYGPHNVMLGNDTLFILDWEWAGWGNPLFDVSWVVWFVHLHYPDMAKELSGAFLSTYTEHTNIQITHDLIRTYATSKVLQIMNRIKNAHPDVQKEWLRRLEWTLHTNFIVNE
ncbi:phosphotransferase family protein [Paenibacillus xylanexedens]|uniref:phosphotransferase family protein n=1 Tax=Paenibacillus xylanexedens TaxID=528191 RepID=UPI0016429140|nr:phosphotransferase [Paenibacillus xylanexedens]